MSLGALITKSRTDAHLSLEDLARATNIPITLLRAMENDNFAKCGGETYARGHLRNMAAKLGIDDRIFLDLFESEVTAPVKPIRELLNENNVTMPYQEPKRVSWKVLAFSSAAALILFGGAQIIFSNLDNSNSADPIVTNSASPSNSVAMLTSPSQTTPPVTPGKVTVEVIASRGTSWLYVTDENGVSNFSGQIRIGDRQVFNQSAQVNLRVGNAGVVDISVDGQNVGSIGANGEVVNLTYNAN
jgi:cytoskeletal protein RodZ